jgi:hypothetical protein
MAAVEAFDTEGIAAAVDVLISAAPGDADALAMARLLSSSAGRRRPTGSSRPGSPG